MLKTIALFRCVTSRISLFFIAVLLVALTFGWKLAPTAYAATLAVGCGDVNALISAIATANSNGESDIINLAGGCTYTLTAINNTADGANGLPSITSDITINGNGSTIERSIAGGTPDFRLFHVASAGTLRLNDLTIANGRATAGGNGVAGGGIFNLGTVELINSTVRNNFATGGGGGIANELAATLNLTGTTISSNIAGNQGGGINNEDGDVILTNSTVSGNTADGLGLGGGIVNFATLYDANLTLNNSTISGNKHNNGSAYSSGGLWSFISPDLAGLPTTYLKNSLIAENDAPNCYSLLPSYMVSQGHNLADDDTCDLSETTDQPNTPPLLGPLADNGGSTHTHALLPGSPAIDTADNAACPATDQRGTGRPFDGDSNGTATCDIGAYELSTTFRDLTITKSVMPQQARPGTPVTYTLTFAYLGDTIATGVIITDIVPLSVTVQNVISSGVAITDTGATPGFVWRVQDMAPNQQGMITITTVLSEALLPGAFTNTATISAAITETNTANNQSQIELTVIIDNAPAFTSVPVTNAIVDTPYSYTVTAVDADVGDVLTLTVPILPAWLNLTDNGNGTGDLSGTPTNAEVGVHSVTLQVTDTTGLTGTQSFSIEVSPAGAGPVFPDPTFTDSGQSLGASHSQAVALGDLDGDGDLDAFVGNNGANNIWQNDGSGSFTLKIGLGDAKSRAVVLADLDGDDDLDAFVANYGGANAVWRNDGNLTFTQVVTMGNSDSRAVALGDLDGDGDLDAFVGNDGANKVWRNDGNLTFTEVVTGLGNLLDSRAVALGDLDGDGDLDALVGNGDGANTMWRNNGGFSFTQMASLGDSVLGNLSSQAVALGDLDGDGDLDAIVGNDNNHPNTVWRNDGGFSFTQMLNLDNSISEFSETVALGDLDGDGDLDVFVGNASGGQTNTVWRNDGNLTFTKVITNLGGSDSYAVALGDVDGDGDLDAFVGNAFNQPNKVWQNDGGGPFVAMPPLDDAGGNAVALGDLDGDGDLDAFISDVSANKLWRNEGGGVFAAMPPLSDSGGNAVALGDLDGDSDLDAFVSDNAANKVWQNEGNFAFSLSATLGNSGGNAVALGDLDGDGDLDAFVATSGAFGTPNEIWRNDSGFNFTKVANLGNSRSQAVALGDLDGDGDLDVFVANLDQGNKVWRNAGNFVFTETDDLGASDSRDLALGDVDGDGDLDAFVVNSGTVAGESNTVWLNGGGGTFVEGANLGNSYSQAVALGDVDGDGDLDAFVLNSDIDCTACNKLYLGKVGGTTRFQVTLSKPDPTAEANFYSTPVILADSPIPFTYTLFGLEQYSLFDPNGQWLGRIAAFYSPNGGGQWFPATLSTDTITADLTASVWPTGTTHTFIWNAEADLIKSDNVVLRIEVYPDFSSVGPYQWPYASARVFPFRVEAAEYYARVVSDTNPVEGAEVYLAGQLVTATTALTTNKAGLIGLNNPNPNQPLVALLQTREQTTTRAAHDNWAYRTYITSLNLNNAGVPSPTLVGEPGPQLVTVRPNDPLILFNLVVSVEWDATDEYLLMLKDAFRKASDYLYDVTDGQMAIGQVNIYDKAEHWADADFQFSTKNTVRPYAFLGGITSADEAHTIRVGRFWDGGSGNSGDWDEPSGYRTLIHEFGHYALYLYDEYFFRMIDGSGNFTGQVDAFCTSDEVLDNPNDTTNASLMFYQYNASELAGGDDGQGDGDRWNENCRYTEQHRLNDESDWETILRHYSGLGWSLNTPTSRGNVMAGPDQFPTALLPFPQITTHNVGVAGGPSRQLTVLDPQNQPAHNILVALYTTYEGMTVAIDQGLTNSQGQIVVYGAIPGDIMRAATFDGAMDGGLTISGETSYTLTLATTSAIGLVSQIGGAPPYLNLIPGTDGDTLALRVQDTPAGSSLLDAIVIPGEGGGSPQATSLAYSSSEGGHIGTVTLAGVGLGTGRVRVSGNALPSAINSDYNLQAVQAITTNHLYSEDGNFELHIPPNGILADGYATVLPTGYVPGPLPTGKQVIGSAYEVRLSGALTELDKEGLVRLHYHPEVMGIYTGTAIYFWEPNTKLWQNRGGEESEVDNALVITATRLGIYTLMGVPEAQAGGNKKVYLPIIIKDE